MHSARLKNIKNLPQDKSGISASAISIELVDPADDVLASMQKAASEEKTKDVLVDHAENFRSSDVQSVPREPLTGDPMAQS